MYKFFLKTHQFYIKKAIFYEYFDRYRFIVKKTYDKFFHCLIKSILNLQKYSLHKLR